MRGRLLLLAAAVCLLFVAAFVGDLPRKSAEAQVSPTPVAVTAIPETITLGKDAKLGQVTFNHLKHLNGDYKVKGENIACTTCHHTAQPAHEAAEHPPLKTAWPADRTAKLTKDLYEKDPATAGVAACVDCHAREGSKPKLMDQIPQITPEGAAAVKLNNQQAFHRACTGCHTDVKKLNTASKGPTAMQCTMCHKKA